MLFQGLFSSNELFISCHELRQIRSIFCDLLRDVKPIRDGHWQSAYADGNHACCFSYDCGVGMFFSFLLCCFFVFDIHISWAGKVSTTIVTDLTASFHVEAPSYFGVQSYENFCEWTKFVAWKVVSFSVLGISVLLLCYLFYLFVSMIALGDYKPALKRLACSAMSSASSK